MMNIIPSGSLESSGWDIKIPDWARPTTRIPIDVGCLAKVLPLGGPTWMNELVIVLEIIESGQSRKTYRVAGRLGEATFPYYALDVQSYEHK
jgi:hypothetical protein